MVFFIRLRVRPAMTAKGRVCTDCKGQSLKGFKKTAMGKAHGKRYK